MSSKAHGISAPIAPELYRRACSQFATGITVITALDEHGHPHGMTLNSFASVSLEPPLVIVSIDLRHAILGHFVTSRFFAVNVLAEHQAELSRRFSSTAENRFHGIDWQPAESGVPLLGGTLARMECAVTQVMEIGDHSVLIGEVQRAEYTSGRPLLFFDSSYRTLE
ncbi:MAG TPA: flavin reductase family protein [Bryobacteraceae bacterium]|nr:flavin reductase family protein [Bryobacteraceae bacterium]